MFPKNRSSLYKLVWSQPLYKLAKHYQVNEQWIINECVKARIPRPLQGYWRAVLKGNAPAVPPLPPLMKEEEPLSKSAIEDRRVTSDYPTKPAGKRVKRIKDVPVSSGAQILEATKEILLAGPVTELGYYRPTKRKLLDINVSVDAFDNAKMFLLKLFAALEKKGLQIRFSEGREAIHRRDISAANGHNRIFLYPSLWKPSNASVVVVDDICIGFSLVEIAEYVYARKVGNRYIPDEKLIQWARGKNPSRNDYHLKKDLPCGRFKLQLYSPYDIEGWVAEFVQSKKSGLVSQIPNIVDAIFKAVPIIREAIAQEKKRHEEWLIEREILIRENEKQEQIRRQQNAVKESIAELNALMIQWRADKLVEQFFVEAKADILKLDVADQELLLSRLEAAKSFVDGASALERLVNWKTPAERLK
ncbi:hypothetical protein K5Y32_22105 [Pantoea sp. DY-15]|uniref:hypothetical protein n=1 Tax=Pantoea sp. DY-15 TaxID=2871489 RepID=UPI001C98A51C|nr:hypothetical protein [Pantoea sp. DY-15]MBY4890631.1 hypothetical protein [Pantoea sp. DY-15]